MFSYIASIKGTVFIRTEKALPYVHCSPFTHLATANRRFQTCWTLAVLSAWNALIPHTHMASCHIFFRLSPIGHTLSEAFSGLSMHICTPLHNIYFPTPLVCFIFFLSPYHHMPYYIFSYWDLVYCQSPPLEYNFSERRDLSWLFSALSPVPRQRLEHRGSSEHICRMNNTKHVYTYWHIWSFLQVYLHFTNR